METNYHKSISNFFIAGINYKKSDATVRGQFAIGNEQYVKVLELAATQGLNELFILSTCNRTEIYGFAYNCNQLIDILCSQTSGKADTFKKLAYIKSGLEAVEHLFNVGAGLDSQILGDYEIVGQIKIAAKLAKEHGFIGAFTERLVNSVLQSSKLIKNHTELSGGTVSVSFAAVQYIRSKVKDIRKKNILLLGVGKIGRNTCKNLVDYLNTQNITLINRTEGKAQELATELGLKHAPLEALSEEIRKAEIILVATNSPQPTILHDHVKDCGNKLIIDLSIPYNVDEAAQNLPNVHLVNVDELSKLKDETLRKREAEVPKAKAIIADLIDEFRDWHEMRRHVPLLKTAKLKLKEIHKHPHFEKATICCSKEADARIQRIINDMASKIRVQNQGACHYIEAINNFMATSAIQS
jgi:glutamyl-tRNA reductase